MFEVFNTRFLLCLLALKFFFFSFVCYLSGRVSLYLSLWNMHPKHKTVKRYNWYCVGSIEEMSNNLYIFSTTNVCTGDEFTNRIYLALFFAHFQAQETKVTEEHILCMFVVFSECRLQSLKSEKIER